MKLSQQRTALSSTIESDMAQKISGGTLAVRPLTLAALASHYNVSITPVRQAVDQLIARGLIIRQSNGRLCAADVAGGDAPVVPEAHVEPSTEALEPHLLRQILHLSLQQQEIYVREEATAVSLGVSRTIIRQLFSKFAVQGLMQHVPRCGWKVQALDNADMLQYLEAREAIEVAALDLAIPKLDPAVLRSMHAANIEKADGRDGGDGALDNRLHAYLLELAGNRYLRTFIETYGAYYTLVFDVAAPGAHVIADMAQQHLAILSGLLEERWDDARDALRAHIRAQAQVVAACIEDARLQSLNTDNEIMKHVPAG